MMMMMIMIICIDNNLTYNWYTYAFSTLRTFDFVCLERKTNMTQTSHEFIEKLTWKYETVCCK